MSKARPTTKVEKANFNYLTDVMTRLEWAIHHPIARRGAIPSEWYAIARRERISSRSRITLRVEDDVLKFFKSLGTGYQTRMNDVLKSFMHARLSGILSGAEEIEEYFFDNAITTPRPKLGASDAMDEEVRRIIALRDKE